MHAQWTDQHGYEWSSEDIDGSSGTPHIGPGGKITIKAPSGETNEFAFGHTAEAADPSNPASALESAYHQLLFKEYPITAQEQQFWQLCQQGYDAWARLTQAVQSLGPDTESLLQVLLNNVGEAAAFAGFIEGVGDTIANLGTQISMAPREQVEAGSERIREALQYVPANNPPYYSAMEDLKRRRELFDHIKHVFESMSSHWLDQFWKPLGAAAGVA